MNESVFSVKANEEMIHGIWHHAYLHSSPSPQNILDEDKHKAIVFLHGWGGYRTGPHDMFVKLARCLAQQGYNCFRFDFRGKGYSEGSSEMTGNRSMLEDLESVLKFVDLSLDNPEISLIGICSGARLALYYASVCKRRLTHVIELSSPILRSDKEATVVAKRQMNNTLLIYVQKVFHKKTWLKLINREIYFTAIWQNISQPFYKLYFSWKNLNKESSKQVKYKKSESKRNTREAFNGLSGHILLIHGEKDPETKSALSQIEKIIINSQLVYDIYIVKNANHSFYSIHWEKEIIDLIVAWLQKQSSGELIYELK